MQYITLQQAALIMSDESRKIPYTTVLYAARIGLLPAVVIKGHIMVGKAAVEDKVIRGYSLPRLTEMIKRDLRQNGYWEPQWETDWEDEEDPMTEEEFDEYERKRMARIAFKPINKNA